MRGVEGGVEVGYADCGDGMGERVVGEGGLALEVGREGCCEG